MICKGKSSGCRRRASMGRSTRRPHCGTASGTLGHQHLGKPEAHCRAPRSAARGVGNLQGGSLPCSGKAVRPAARSAYLALGRAKRIDQVRLGQLVMLAAIVDALNARKTGCCSSRRRRPSRNIRHFASSVSENSAGTDWNGSWCASSLRKRKGSGAARAGIDRQKGRCAVSGRPMPARPGGEL